MMTARRVEDAATVAGVTHRTASRWLKQDAVKAALSAALDDVLGLATRRVVSAMLEAVGTLAEVYQDPEQPAGARVSAARAILDAGPRLREALDLAARVADLEQCIGEGQR